MEGKTTPQAPPPQSQRPTPPRIVAHYAAETWTRIRWEAYDHDSYFINITGPFGTPKGSQELRTINMTTMGRGGDHTLGGLLPGRTYTVGVQGCTETIFGLGEDHCRDWSAWLPAKTLPMALHIPSPTPAPRRSFGGRRLLVTTSVLR